MNSVPADFRKLPVSERIQLVEDIWDSIAEDSAPFRLSDEDCEELRQRMAAHVSDPASSLPWNEVREALFKDQG